MRLPIHLRYRHPFLEDLPKLITERETYQSLLLDLVSELSIRTEGKEPVQISRSGFPITIINVNLTTRDL